MAFVAFEKQHGDREGIEEVRSCPDTTAHSVPDLCGHGTPFSTGAPALSTGVSGHDYLICLLVRGLREAARRPRGHRRGPSLSLSHTHTLTPLSLALSLSLSLSIYIYIHTYMYVYVYIYRWSISGLREAARCPRGHRGGLIPSEN